MKYKKSSVYYIENLTADSWAFYILPHFLKDGKMALQEAGQIYYFNNSRLGLWLANFTSRFMKVQIKRADFRQGETRDQDGHLIWMRTMEDTLSIQNEIKKNSEFQKALASCHRPNSLHLFLNKWMMSRDLITMDVFLMLKFSFLVRAMQHKEILNDTIRTSRWDVFFFMQERPWFVELKRFVKLKGINVIPAGNFYLYIKAFLAEFDNLKLFLKESCKRAAYGWMALRYRLKQSNNVKTVNDVMRKEGAPPGSRMAVEYYGYLNFDSPELFSDLFFLRGSSLSPRDILIYFGLPKAPITDREWNEIRKWGMSAVAINPRAAATAEVPLFNHKQEKIKADWSTDEVKDNKDVLTHKWLRRYVSNYHQRYDFWGDFIKQHNVKVHVTWFKYSADHCTILDALQNTGGVGVVYERSFEHLPAHWTFTTADVVFGFSQWGAHIGRDKVSRIPYYIVTGYLGDHRFGLLQKRADNVRQSMRNHGAKRIVAYFDEHATDHPRWDLAYQVTIKNYTYLLNKVLENPWLGLILKPKVPSTLRSRLGAVSDLLARAQKTGRCFVFEDSDLQGSCPPAVASLGADIAIHGHLFAATAGIESALAGVPTLILDSEGVSESLLNNSRGGQIIFKDIGHIWQICEEHWSRPGGVPGFANWSAVLEDLDPFRDGRAAERMGAYLGWLMEGFKGGLPRETVLADAAERYSRIWGKDKVLSVNVPSKTDFNKSHLTRIG